ncbi:MAG: protein kinase, partial [Deltaproteobacteria bacterium]|nr:protein kinase [Deltaproteobacteria bacterium]
MTSRFPKAPSGYEIEALLGEGGMGQVFLARHLASQEKVALKFLQEPGQGSQELREEVKLLSRLFHPRLVKVFDYYPEGPCFAMEYVPGKGTAGELFAAGVAFYEALSGRLPYATSGSGAEAFQHQPPSLKAMRPDLPEYFVQIIHRLLEIHPARRPSSAHAVLKYLNQHLEKPLPLLDAGGAAALLDALPLVGREAEWKRLENLEGELVLLTGPTGIGRSRLLKEIKWKFQLQGRPIETLSPQAGLGWRALFGEANPSASHWLNLEDRDWNALGEKAPAILVPELHRWPKASRQELRLFLQKLRSQTAGLSIVLEYDSSRIEDGPGFQRDWESMGAKCVSLSSLSKKDALKLVESVDIEAKVSLERRRRLVAEAGGNPLLLLETLRHSLSADADREATIPKTLEEAVLAKINELSEDGRKLLALIVASPKPFPGEN